MGLHLHLDTTTAEEALDRLEARVRSLRPASAAPDASHAELEAMVDRRVEQILAELTGVAQGG